MSLFPSALNACQKIFKQRRSALVPVLLRVSYSFVIFSHFPRFLYATKRFEKILGENGIRLRPHSSNNFSAISSLFSGVKVFERTGQEGLINFIKISYVCVLRRIFCCFISLTRSNISFHFASSKTCVALPT